MARGREPGTITGGAISPAAFQTLGRRAGLAQAMSEEAGRGRRAELASATQLKSQAMAERAARERLSMEIVERERLQKADQELRKWMLSEEHRLTQESEGARRGWVEGVLADDRELQDKYMKQMGLHNQALLKHQQWMTVQNMAMMLTQQVEGDRTRGEMIRMGRGLAESAENLRQTQKVGEAIITDSEDFIKNLGLSDMYAQKDSEPITPDTFHGRLQTVLREVLGDKAPFAIPFFQGREPDKASAREWIRSGKLGAMDLVKIIAITGGGAVELANTDSAIRGLPPEKTLSFKEWMKRGWESPFFTLWTEKAVPSGRQDQLKGLKSTAFAHEKVEHFLNELKNDKTLLAGEKEGGMTIGKMTRDAFHYLETDEEPSRVEFYDRMSGMFESGDRTRIMTTLQGFLQQLGAQRYAREAEALAEKMAGEEGTLLKSQVEFQRGLPELMREGLLKEREEK